jgi:pimeloyl-ACP methyl ester carboxylesterase
MERMLHNNEQKNNLMRMTKIVAALCPLVFSFLVTIAMTQPIQPAYKSIRVAGLEIFYREAGDPSKPVILLLHGFPSSSHMYRDLMNDLSASYHLIAPDYPGFGSSSCPSPEQFTYSFDHLADIMMNFIDTLGLRHYVLYMQDYGGPIGFRIACRHPERVSALVIQNANAYKEGLGAGFKKIMDLEDAGDTASVSKILDNIISFDGIKVQYTDGAMIPAHVNPDAFLLDFCLVSRPGNGHIQNALFQNYHKNLLQYPEWQQYFRNHHPPTLIVWGKNDPIFTAAGALAYRKDLKNAEIHLLDGGHFALVEYDQEIAADIRAFLQALPVKDRSH